MPNSDNLFGTYNKNTKIISQPSHDWATKQSFADTDAAKTFFFTDEALAVIDECCTNVQWALVADDNGDNTQLKYTFDFGTKGAGTAPGDDWAEQYNTRKTALINSNGWIKPGVESIFTDDSNHLF